MQLMMGLMRVLQLLHLERDLRLYNDLPSSERTDIYNVPCTLLSNLIHPILNPQALSSQPEPFSSGTLSRNGFGLRA